MSGAVQQAQSPNPGSGEMFDQIAGRYDPGDEPLLAGSQRPGRHHRIAHLLVQAPYGV